MRTSKDIDIYYDKEFNTYYISEKQCKYKYLIYAILLKTDGSNAIKRCQAFFKSKGVYIRFDRLVKQILKEIVKL